MNLYTRGQLPQLGQALGRSAPSQAGCKSPQDPEGYRQRFHLRSNYHTGVTGTAALTVARETMSRLLATPGPTDVFVNLAPGGSVSRLQIFSVTLTYTAPAPNTLLLLVAGATIVGAAALIKTRAGGHKPEPGQS